jgi:hypothetical protein
LVFGREPGARWAKTDTSRKRAFVTKSLEETDSCFEFRGRPEPNDFDLLMSCLESSCSSKTLVELGMGPW